ncbi:hypothetical protein [Aureimonas leprariae]|uniref:Addiction module component n=1 Tax=Plantimonas leprariae TaxID=2615207 RepID=A0A7V7TXN2_9HYPH|nr:hypothetical protein [Aureimonas leprariae]KAB0681280.1 hypothetical protein F6X38_05150 [Aureimonas leprariae]
MNALLEIAIEQVRALPPERQEEIAQVLLEMAATDEDVYVLTPAEKASLAASIAQAERGEFASDEEVEAIWAKHSG